MLHEEQALHKYQRELLRHPRHPKHLQVLEQVEDYQADYPIQ